MASVEFFFRKSGAAGPGAGQPFMTFTLTNAFITAIQMRSDSGSEGPVEEIQLVFGQSKLEIHNVDPRTGQVTARSTTVGYDLTKAALM
ncbi:MAG: type VI secretion system tube protein Hcp [Ktedonobacteraceae bacterium]